MIKWPLKTGGLLTGGLLIQVVTMTGFIVPMYIANVLQPNSWCGTGKARSHAELSEDQREQKLSSVPGPLEYFTFMFSFHSVLTGPVCTIRDYQDFMTGSNFTAHPPPDVHYLLAYVRTYAGHAYSLLEPDHSKNT